MLIDIPKLLEPISEASPSGADLRYHPITEKIKEARRQDEDLAQGVWKLELKAADYPLVVKLSVEALTKLGKDLQIAAWLTEALANLHGIAGFREGLDLMQGLLETFWDTVYPLMDEDGDLDLRSVPLSWIGSQLGPAVRSAAILKGGYNWYNYRSSRSIPTEEQAQLDPAKMTARTEALEEGGVSPEDFEKGFDATPLAALRATQQDFAGFGARVEELNQFCNDKFGDQSPDFGPLRATIEEVGGVVRVLYKKKESIEGINEPEPPGAAEEPTQAAETYVADEPVAAAPRRRAETHAAQPTGADDAIARIVASAHYLRRENPQNPVPYLVLRSLRWAEFRALQGSPDAFPAPRSEVRVELKRLLGEGSWEALREAAEDAAAQPCGRAWIDLQRYAVLACRYSGCYQAADAIVSAVRALLAEFPDLPASLLADDTPAANSETARWLQEESIVKEPEPPAELAAFAPPPPELEPWIPPVPAGDAPPDAFDLAMEAARGGRTEEAVEILTREIAQGDSGRARFLRRAQLAQICLAAGQDAMSLPLLEDLSEEIARRGLEQWEAPGLVSQPLAMLYRCLKNGGANEERERLYARICKLDPPAALRLAR